VLTADKNDFHILSFNIPEGVKAKHLIEELYLRPFGYFIDDLGVDFNHEFRPYIATQILECCIRNRDGEKVNQNLFWDLTLDKRIECLITIATLENSSGLPISLRCLNETCQKMTELEISKDEITDLQLKADSFMIRIGDENLEMRKPTGRDQIKWLETPLINKDTVIREMIRTLLQEDKENSSGTECGITDIAVKAIDELMDEFDPLINFNLTVRCPYCDKDSIYEIDLEEISLQRLHEAQKSLFLTVHRLASHYHWSEHAIFSIPHWRRIHYLSLIGKEETL
jgi:hypothetical protein